MRERSGLAQRLFRKPECLGQLAAADCVAVAAGNWAAGKGTGQLADHLMSGAEAPAAGS